MAPHFQKGCQGVQSHLLPDPSVTYNHPKSLVKPPNNQFSFEYGDPFAFHAHQTFYKSHLGNLTVPLQKLLAFPPAMTPQTTLDSSSTPSAATGFLKQSLIFVSTMAFISTKIFLTLPKILYHWSFPLWRNQHQSDYICILMHSIPSRNSMQPALPNHSIPPHSNSDQWFTAQKLCRRKSPCLSFEGAGAETACWQNRQNSCISHHLRSYGPLFHAPRMVILVSGTVSALILATGGRWCHKGRSVLRRRLQPIAIWHQELLGHQF